MKFNIYNQSSGVDLGTYEGVNVPAALDAMARDAGYRDYAEACDVAAPVMSEIIITEVANTMKLKISKKMASLLTPGVALDGKAIVLKIDVEVEAGRADKSGAVTIDADTGNVIFLRELAKLRISALDLALQAATTDEERKPHFGEHSAWRALQRQIEPNPATLVESNQA